MLRVIRPALPALLLLPAALLAGKEAKEVEIVIYAACGSPEAVWVTGRALEAVERAGAAPDDSAWVNLRRTLDDLETDEVVGLPLLVECGGVRARILTDEEGFFEVRLPAPQNARFRVSPSPRVRLSGAAAAEEFLVEPREVTPILAESGSLVVVSDLDDTVVESAVTDRSEMLRRTFLRNASTLEPVPGMAALYREIRDSSSPRPAFLYLSGSPVNLHPRLLAFLGLHAFPVDGILLKNLGLTGADPLFGQEAFKSARLRELARRMPGARFLLIGDSGQADLAVYTRFRKEHPDRVAGILIRRIPHHPPPDPPPEGVLFARDGTEAAKMLSNQGLLSQEAALRVQGGVSLEGD